MYLFSSQINVLFLKFINVHYNIVYTYERFIFHKFNLKHKIMNTSGVDILQK